MKISLKNPLVGIRWQTFILLLSVILFGIGLTLAFYYTVYLTEYHSIPIDFRVEKMVGGLDVDTDALHFGTLTPGGTSERNMIVTPVRDARLLIEFRGGAAPFVTVIPNNIHVSKGVQQRLNFTVVVPLNATVGNYTGEARFFFYSS